MGLREQILAAKDLAREQVEVPAWGLSEPVYVREMTGAERDAFEAFLIDNRGPDEKANLRGVRARLVALTLVDKDGNRIFSDADIDAVGGKGAKSLEPIVEKAMALNALRQKDVEALAKNSETAQGEG